MSDKKFFGIYKAKTFEIKDGSKFQILKVSFPMSELQEMISIAEKNNGWINLDVKRRREVSEKGITHYGELNTFKPKNESDI